jgi:hypothetical protein
LAFFFIAIPRTRSPRDRTQTAKSGVFVGGADDTACQTAFSVELGAERKNLIEPKVGKSLGKIFGPILRLRKNPYKH